MKRVKYVLLSSLTILMLLLLPACNKDAESDNLIGEINTANASGNLSYRAERLDILLELGYMNAFAFDKNVLYVCASQLDGEDEVVSIYKASIDGETITKLDYSEPTATETILSMDVDQNSNLWVLENASEYRYNAEGGITGENVSYQLIKFSPSGEVADYIPIENGLFPLEARTHGGYIYVICHSKLVVFDDMGSKLFEIDLTQINATIKTDRGIVAGTTSATGYRISLLNFDEQRFEIIADFDTSVRRICGSGNTIFIDDGTRLYSYDIDTTESELLLNWASAGLLGHYNELFSLSDTEILYCAFDGVYVLHAYERGPSDDADGGIITLATFNAATVNRQVLEYNISNDRYTIEIADYSIYNTNENNSEGLTKLATDIIAGNVPDIIDLSDIPSDMYENNSLLEDLMPFLENGNGFGVSDCEPAVLEAMKTNGRLYNFTPLFTILTIAGSGSDIANNRIDSFSDLQTIAQGSSVFGSTVSRSHMIMYALGANNSKYYDFDTGVCSFNTNEFIEFLEFVKTLPDEADYQGYDVNIASGSQRFMCEPIGSIGQIIANRQFFGGSMGFVGLPSHNNETLIIPYYSYGMSATSEHKDGVWEFFEILASDSFIENHSSSLFTIKKSVTEHNLQLARNWLATGGSFYYVLGNQEIETFITDGETDIELYYGLLSSVTGIFRHNEALYNIVIEDASDFFSGVTTAEQAAERIQNRASVYLSERR